MIKIKVLLFISLISIGMSWKTIYRTVDDTITCYKEFNLVQTNCMKERRAKW